MGCRTIGKHNLWQGETEWNVGKGGDRKCTLQKMGLGEGGLARPETEAHESGLCDYEVSLVYTVSSKIAKAM